MACKRSAVRSRLPPPTAQKRVGRAVNKSKSPRAAFFISATLPAIPLGGIWLSCQRACMACKRSAVSSRQPPPTAQKRVGKAVNKSKSPRAAFFSPLLSAFLVACARHVRIICVSECHFCHSSLLGGDCSAGCIRFLALKLSRGRFARAAVFAPVSFHEIT